MEQDRSVAEWTLTAQPVRPNFATLVAVAVARQSASPTAQVIAAAEAGTVEPVSLVDLFGRSGRTRAAATSCFNSGVAALLTPEQER